MLQKVAYLQLENDTKISFFKDRKELYQYILKNFNQYGEKNE